MKYRYAILYRVLPGVLGETRPGVPTGFSSADKLVAKGYAAMLNHDLAGRFWHWVVARPATEAGAGQENVRLSGESC